MKLPDGLAPLVVCVHCQMHRYARLSPACPDHLETLLVALRAWEGTPRELDDVIDGAMHEGDDHGASAS